MSEPISDRAAMIAQMDPWLDPVRYRYVAILRDNAARLLGEAIATFREDEGISAIVPEAAVEGIAAEDPVLARIVLRVHSALEGVGLTAAVSAALADGGIACNVVAALHHDQLFVPADRADEAMTILQALSQDAGGAG